MYAYSDQRLHEYHSTRGSLKGRLGVLEGLSYQTRAEIEDIKKVMAVLKKQQEDLQDSAMSLEKEVRGRVERETDRMNESTDHRLALQFNENRRFQTQILDQNKLFSDILDEGKYLGYRVDEAEKQV